MALSKTNVHDSTGEQTGLMRSLVSLVQTLALLVANSVKHTDVVSGPVQIGTNTAKAQPNGTTAYSIDGEMRAIGGTVNLWTFTGPPVPPSTFQKYLMLLDVNRVPSVVPCTSSQVSAAAVQYPDLFVTLEGKSLIGVVTVATNASTTFTPDVTALNAAGITTTFRGGFDKNMLVLLADDQNAIIKN